ncbi:MAG TPA: Zn-dependent hydrolase [Caulobacteraceae bacterium]|jgi:N-carbamoyl-L-amino-acid hydrolase|nr:Zn-dependent hydrolase [Caulobacteraceae bacterium]
MDIRRPDRRLVLGSLAAITLAVRASGAAGQSISAPLRIDPARLRKSLEDLSVFGRPAGGSFEDGVSRYAYSDADIAGRAYVTGLIRVAGVTPRIDAAGNIRARREGSVPGLKPIMIGSHIDSVPNGGNFDGALGSLAAVEILRTLNERQVRLRHPLEVVLWSNEEGGTIGSEAVAGQLPAASLDLVMNGISRRDGIRRIGGDPDHLGQAQIPPGSLAAYVELHIEQSDRLEQAGVKIGVVDGIVAIDEYEVEIIGTPNHAGTTPMADRRNALLAAARLVEAVQEEVTRVPGRQVGTVGHLEVYPNVRNIVPGRVKCSIELRDLDPAKIGAIGEAIRTRALAVAAGTGTQITITKVEGDDPALASPAIQGRIEQAAADLGLSTMHLPSGAGHDAAPMSMLAPMGMIFVPSIGGVSHSPKERTTWDDCANGANVLLGTVLKLDQA